MKKQILGIFLCLCLLVPLRACLLAQSMASGLTMDTNEEEAFRRQELTEEGLLLLLQEEQKAEISLARLLANGMLHTGFCLSKGESRTLMAEEAYIRYKPEEYRKLVKSYEAIWGDVTCFPVAKTKVWFEDTWGAPRSFGGERSHEGTDIFGEADISGCYPVLSMTAGVVEQVGWLPMGGYRIGIRSPHGGYFYYAHLSSYQREFQMGDTVTAGEILGFMGNTGYGGEGTAGEFPVHLHLGIYIETTHHPEQSVNPYWVLRYLEEKEKI